MRRVKTITVRPRWRPRLSTYSLSREVVPPEVAPPVATPQLGYVAPPVATSPNLAGVDVIKFAKRASRGLFYGKLLLCLIATVGVVVSSDVMIASYIKRRRGGNIYNSIKAGSVPEVKEIKSTLLPRNEARDVLERIITNPSTKYHLISGDHGVGKTTLIKTAAAGKNGVVYVDVPDGYNLEQFAKSWGTSFNYDPNESYLSFTSAIYRRLFGLEIRRPEYTDPLRTWSQLKEEVMPHFAKYKRETGRVPVLIFDNINRMAKKDLILLEAIQEAAKDNIDDQKMKMIFVSSEGRAPLIMQQKSVSSRMITREIYDLSVEEAKEYLLTHRHLPLTEQQVEYLVNNVTGTRLNILTEVADLIYYEGYSVEEAEKAQLAKAVIDFGAAQFNENETEYAGKLVLLLKRKGSVDLEEFEKLVPSLETRQKLLQPQVFSIHLERSYVTIQTKRMERYCNGRFK